MVDIIPFHSACIRVAFPQCECVDEHSIAHYWPISPTILQYLKKTES